MIDDNVDPYQDSTHTQCCDFNSGTFINSFHISMQFDFHEGRKKYCFLEKLTAANFQSTLFSLDNQLTATVKWAVGCKTFYQC